MLSLRGFLFCFVLFFACNFGAISRKLFTDDDTLFQGISFFLKYFPPILNLSNLILSMKYLQMALLTSKALCIILVTERGNFFLINDHKHY